MSGLLGGTDAPCALAARRRWWRARAYQPCDPPSALLGNADNSLSGELTQTSWGSVVEKNVRYTCIFVDWWWLVGSDGCGSLPVPA